jgi:hypothetical protein
MNKAKAIPGWETVSRKLAEDTELSEEIARLEPSLKDGDSDESRRTLKVPYAGATPLRSRSAWN